ncbi:hypothetical protein C1645_771042 [Glomus cerebriforme]|uniref:Uncharacterized protein n=1 Tax=Glomus cerebriforme TaxID=658196 RepID=A0A397SZB1_9GLOM|nr:hypothetical protein C1645_771042 [Glomus cerebriforme]
MNPTHNQLYNTPIDNNLAASYSGENSSEGSYQTTSALQTPVPYPLTPNFQNQSNQLHPIKFYYLPPDDSYYYFISCKNISYAVTYLLNNGGSNIQFSEYEHTFYFQQQYNNQIYQISCEIVPPYSITYYLNKSIYGNEIVQNNIVQEKLEFTFQQKKNIEFHLTQYLNQYIILN